MNIKKPFKSYKGDGKFAYACYALADSDYVFPLLLNLNKERYRIRYDEGVQDEIQVDALRKHNIRNCEIFIAFISKQALISQYFLNQIEKANEFNANIYVVYLDGTETVEQASKFFDSRVRSIKIDECTDDVLHDILCQLLTDCQEPETVKERVYTYEELLDEVYPGQENKSRNTFDATVQQDNEKIQASAAVAADAAVKAKKQKRKKNGTAFFNAILVVGVILAIAFGIYCLFGEQLNEMLNPDDVIYYSPVIANKLGFISKLL